jgi:LmbE family N-acetylglucosaminyl deacetylase
MRILAIGAHPDDLEFLCAGTLAKYAQKKNKVFMAYLCQGNMGGEGIEPKKLAEIRAKEAREAAKLIGAEVLGGIAGDLDLYPDRETRVKVVDIIRQARPDIIFTHSPQDYMPDHVTTSQLVFEASFTATLPNFKTRYKAHKLITPIFYLDTMAGINFLPTDYVDITETIEMKKKMLLCHQSQQKWVKGHHGTDMVGFLEIMAKFRGLQCNVPYAEAFQKAPFWGRLTPKKLLP